MSNTKFSSHLSKEDRKTIQQRLDKDLDIKLNELAFSLKKDPRTISKEVKKHRKLKSMQGKRDFNNSDITKIKPCKYINRWPYVCNGCCKRNRCCLDQYDYDFEKANNEYRELLVHSRNGINCDSAQILEINKIISDGLDKKQSINVITSVNKLNKCPKTIYTYIYIKEYYQKDL